MKVLSIKEPYATFISKKIKYIETRSWKTNYRGELYIHASLGNEKISAEKSKNKRINDLIENTNFNNGYIICKAKLVDCIYMDDDFINKIKENEIEYLLGLYKVGRYAWLLEDIEEIKRIPAKGKLGIWNYNI